MHQTPVPTIPQHNRTIADARAQFTAAEAMGESRLPNATLRGRIERLRLNRGAASFLWIEDDTSTSIEGVVRTRAGNIVPPDLREGHWVELRGPVMRYRGSDAQIEIRSIRMLPQKGISATAPKPCADGCTVPFAARRPWPAAISSVGVVTSPGSQALGDILDVIERRCPWVRVVVAPASLEGSDAAEAMVGAILRLHVHTNGVDVILLARGGCTEPARLSPFADRLLLAAMQASRIPIVTAIGHAGDHTPADGAASRSYATPSVAAVEVLPDKESIRQELDAVGLRIQRHVAPAVRGSWSALMSPRAPGFPDVCAWESASPALWLDGARQRLARLAAQLDGDSASGIVSPSHIYTAAADLCLARSVLESASVAVTTLTDTSPA